jgi:hypothetical protein
MQRDILVFEMSTMVAIVCALTERGHGFEVTTTDNLMWRIRLTGAF